jgi:tetratricopeptide (TPR) repeat protein
VIQPKVSLKIGTQIGFVPLVTTLLLINWSLVWGAEPLMDGGVMEFSRGGAIISVKEGKFSVAARAEEQALKIAQDQYGPLHPSLIPLYSDLATLHRYLADYEKAEEEYKWALALCEKNLDPDDPQIADSLEHLAALYNDLGLSLEAELAAKRALAIRETGTTQNPQVLAQTQGLLGKIELSIGHNSQAQNLFQKALENIQKDPSADTRITLDFFQSMAKTYSTTQNYVQAQTYLEKATELAEKKFNADAIEVADAIEQLADFFHHQGQDEKAQPLYISAFNIDRHYIGTVYSYGSLPYLKRLAKASLSVGDAKSSETLWQKSLQTEKQVFGHLHPQVALDLAQLAKVEWVLGEKSEARKSLQESIDMLKSYFPDSHPLVVQVQNELENFEK